VPVAHLAVVLGQCLPLRGLADPHAVLLATPPSPHTRSPTLPQLPLRCRAPEGPDQGETVRTLFTNFRNFAFSGSLVDLAVGLAIGTAFAAVVQALVDNVIMPLVAAIFGVPNFDDLVLTVNGSDIRYGAFLTVFVSFLLLALTIMLLVQAIRKATGKEAAGAQGNRECDHCKSFIPVDATVCMFCTRDVEPLVA
jgi:large conductance mechanosensitive channel